MTSIVFTRAGLLAAAAIASTGSLWAADIAVPADFPTIQAAINAASPGDTIVVAAGTRTEAPVNVNKAVTIQGPNAGVSGTGVRVAEARISNTALNITAAGVVIDGLEIHQTDNTLDAVLVQAAATVKNSIIKREGVTTGNSVRGITTAVGLTGATISGNLFTGDPSNGLFGGHKTWNSGMYVNGGSITISGNTFENCRSALNLDDFNAGITLTGNTFRTCGTYLSFGGTVPTPGSHVISGNAFGYDFNLAPAANPTLFNNSNVAATFRIDATGNTFGGIATNALSNAQKFSLEARMFHRGRSTRNGVIDYSAGEQVVVAGTTIASAIDAAAAGDTVLVGPGTFTEDVTVTKALTLQGTGAGTTTLVGPIGGGADTVRIAASNATVDGFTITRAGNNVTDWNNPGLNISGLAIQGQALTGTTISNNEITGMRTAIDINHSNGHTVRNNVIHNNRTGLIFRNQTDNLIVTENRISNNWTVGILFLDGSGGTNSPVQTAAGCTFSNNDLSGNWYGQVVDRQTGGSLPVPGTNLKNFEGNWFGTDTPVVSVANSAEPGYAALIPVAFGGTATAPGGQPDIAGAASANVDYSPRLSLGTDTDVETAPGRGTYGFQGNQSSLWDGSTPSIEIDAPESYPSYFIPTGTTVTITSTGSLQAGELEVAPGATLVVEGGGLIFGDGSKISGSFTIFNSFGSWEINGDTTFEIGRSLALISDIHVAAGATLTVNGGGELLLDGCVIDSQTPGSPFFIEVENDGLLTLARSVVSDARIDVDTLASSVPANFRSRIFDNRFTASDIEATADSRVYHNLFDAATDLAANTDASAAFDPVDGWANVTSEGSLQNRFALEFAAPADPTRTLDAGNLFVQPSDPVVLDLKVASLGSNTIIAAEALLGYNSDLLSLVSPSPAVSPESGWSVIVDDDSIDGALGLVDSAIGLDLVGPGNDGISADSTVAKVNFTATTPGMTVGFFRAQTDNQFNPDGSFVKDTRLTKSTLGVPSFLSAFTSNSGELVIDNQDPVIATPAVSGTQVQPSQLAPVDVLSPANRVLRNGVPVILTFTATDAGLAGLDPLDASDDLVLTADNGITVLNSSNYTVLASESMGVVTYTVTLTVPATATTGTYAVEATVLDRSGNQSAEALLGSFVVANEAIATVELQSFGGTTRDVTFVATNGGGTVLASWTKTITNFSGGIGSVALENVPAGTAAISAKTAWTLRSKVSASFSPVGVGSVALTGVDLLKAGDLTGDNVINTLDYATLRFNWLTTNAVADITGDGLVQSNDYLPLQANFYTVGEPQ